MTKIKDFWDTIKITFKDWNARNVGIDATSLAYSAIFSIPGLLIIVIWTAGIFFGEEAVRGEITQNIGEILGKDVGESIEGMIVKTMIDAKNFWLKAFGVITLIFGATSLFFQLQKSLNKLWDVEAHPKSSWKKYLLDRANSLGLILIIGFLLLITLIASSIISVANTWIVNHFHLETYLLVQFINFVIGFITTALLFAIMFKVLPDVNISWKSVRMGAIVTTILFTIGKYLLTFYFNRFSSTSVFGAAGSVIIIMIWVNYTCQLIFLGAEYTKVYSKKKGFEIKPSQHARGISDKNKYLVYGVEPEEPEVNPELKSAENSSI